MEMKEKYEQPVIKLVSFEQTDVITASLGDGDNTIDDSFFD